MLRRIILPIIRSSAPKPRLFYLLRYDSRLGTPCAYTTNAQSEINRNVNITSQESEIFSPFVAVHIEKGAGFYQQMKIQHFRQVLEHSSRYEGSIFTEKKLRAELCDPVSCDLEAFNEQDLGSLSDAELVEIFRKVTSYAVSRNIPMSEDCFTRVCTAVKERLTTFTSENLIIVGKLFTLWPTCEGSRGRTFSSFRRALDNACVHMYNKNRKNYLLLAQMAELWYWSKLGSENSYLGYIMSRVLLSKAPQNIIQFLFYANIMKSWPASVNAFTVETGLVGVEPVCTFDELVLACSSLFKVKKRLHNPDLTRALLRRLKKEASNVHVITLDALCEILKRCSFPDCRGDLCDVQNILTSRVPELSFMTLKSLAFLGSMNAAIKEEFFFAVYEKVLKNCATMRLNDLSETFFALTLYSLDSLNIQKLAERVGEVICSPDMKTGLPLNAKTVNLIHLLMTYGICPMDLVENLMSSANSKKVRPEISPFLLNIDVMLEVLYPEYKGERLNAEISKAVYEAWFVDERRKRLKQGGEMQFNSCQFTEWIHLFQCALDNQMDHFMVINTVPFSSFVDIVICTDKKGSFVPVPKELLQYKPWELKRIPQCVGDDGRNLIVFTFLAKDSKQYGMVQHQREKRMILEKLGYRIVPIQLGEWTNENKATYLLNLLDSLRDIK